MGRQEGLVTLMDILTPPAITDESGRYIAPPQQAPQERPQGPWNTNTRSLVLPEKK